MSISIITIGSLFAIASNGVPISLHASMDECSFILDEMGIAITCTKLEDALAYEAVSEYGETSWVSQPKVMCSNAGWYVGRDCFEEDPVSTHPAALAPAMPYDRMSDYYKSEDAAKKFLDALLSI